MIFFVCMNVCVPHARRVTEDQKNAITSGIAVTEGCEPLCVFLWCNSGPLEDQPVLLITTQPSFKPQVKVLKEKGVGGWNLISACWNSEQQCSLALFICLHAFCGSNLLNNFKPECNCRFLQLAILLLSYTRLIFNVGDKIICVTYEMICT